MTNAVPAGSACPFCGETNPERLHVATLTGSDDRSRRTIVCDHCVATLKARSPQEIAPAQPAAMSDQDMRRETRRQKAFKRLGTDYPRCCACLMDDWRCLELHHLEGKDFGETLVILCRNCHRQVSEPQKDHPPMLGGPPKRPERIGHLLLGAADLFVLLAGRFKDCGEYLIGVSGEERPS